MVARELIQLPNVLSILRMFLSLCLGVLIYECYINQTVSLSLLLILLIVIYLTDVADGHIARKRNQTSIIGAKLDITSDMLLVITSYVGFILAGKLDVWFLALAIVIFYQFFKSQEDRRESLVYDGLGRTYGVGCMLLPIVIVLLDLLNVGFKTELVTFIIVILAIMGFVTLVYKISNN